MVEGHTPEVEVEHQLLEYQGTAEQWGQLE
jgi:hypothetical protein